MHSLAARYDTDVLLEMEALAESKGFPIVGRLCGVTLELVARSIGARRIFELGSGFGYSAYWFARATGDEGEIHLTDADPQNAAKAKDHLTRAGLWGPVTYHVGDALCSLQGVAGLFDIVYCDAFKEGYPDLWRAGRDRVRVGGMWICDNTLWSGRVIETEQDERARAIVEHNELVSNDPDFISTIVPLRDGLMVALRVS
jgi:caffeoyl-CoA O-methyltransferase